MSLKIEAGKPGILELGVNAGIYETRKTRRLSKKNKRILARLRECPDKIFDFVKGKLSHFLHDPDEIEIIAAFFTQSVKYNRFVAMQPFALAEFLKKNGSAMFENINENEENTISEEEAIIKKMRKAFADGEAVDFLMGLADLLNPFDGQESCLSKCDVTPAMIAKCKKILTRLILDGYILRNFRIKIDSGENIVWEIFELSDKSIKELQRGSLKFIPCREIKSSVTSMVGKVLDLFSFR